MHALMMLLLNLAPEGASFCARSVYPTMTQTEVGWEAHTIMKSNRLCTCLQVLLKVQADRMTNACKVNLLEATCTAADGSLIAKLQRTHETENQFHQRQACLYGIPSSLL